MPNHPLLLRSASIFLAAITAAFAIDSDPAFNPHKIAVPEQASGFVFSLLPHSFQANPRSDITMICEMTDAGRKKPLVTKKDPAYFVAQSAGYRETGEDVVTQKVPIGIAVQNLERALAVNGFMPAKEGQKPDYILIYHWGNHSSYGDATGLPNDTLSTIISRASLVGGLKFAADLEKALVETASDYTATTAADADGNVMRATRSDTRDALVKASTSTSGISGASDGTSLTAMLDSLTPFERFKRLNNRNSFLVEQCMQGIYFVVISAYDHNVFLKEKKRVLLWRAKLTIDAQGIALSDAIPALALNGAKYLGRDMEVPATGTPRIMRGKETITIGEIEAIDEGKGRSK
jgi:hypothetical protein